MGQILDIPIDGGLDENADDRLRDRLAVAEDVVYKRRGGLTPRLGQKTVQVTQLVSWNAPMTGDRALFARGNQVASVTNGIVRPLSLDVGSPAVNLLGSAGIVSAYTVERQNIGGSGTTQKTMAMAEGRGFRCYVWTENLEVFFCVVDTDSQAIIIPQTTTTSASQLAPKVVFAGGFFFIIVSELSITPQKVYAVDPLAGTLAPAVVLAGTPINTGFAAVAHPDGTHFMVACQISTSILRVTICLAAYPSPTTTSIIDIPIDPAAVSSIGMNCATAARCWLVYGTGGTPTINVAAYVARVSFATPAAPTLALAPVVIFSENQTDPIVNGGVNIWACSILDRGASLGAFVAFTPTGLVATNRFYRPATGLYRCDDAGGVNTLDNTEWAFGGALASDIWTNAAGVAFCTVFQTVPFMAPPGVGIVPPLGCMHVVAFLRATPNRVATVPLDAYPCQVHATYGVLVTPTGDSLSVVISIGNQTRLPSGPSPVLLAEDGTAQVICYALERADTSPHAYLATMRPTESRSHAQMGGRTFIAGGLPALWDGRSVVEWGFVHGPRYFGSGVTNQANSIGAGTYSYAAGYEWIDANGGVMHSPVTLLIAQQTFTANQKITISIAGSQLSHKADFYGGMGHFNGPAYIVLFRTEANSTQPFYRLTALDVDVANWNRYGNPQIQIVDAYPDNGGARGPLATFPPIYTNGDTLAADPVPSCSMVTTWQQRFVIAGTDDDSVWFSTENEDGEVPFFSLGLRLAPFENGRITGIAVLDDKLVLFKQSGIYTLAGQLPNRQGSGAIPQPTQVSTDAGCIDPQSVVVFPQGVMFRSARGLYVLDRSLNVSFIGDPVARLVEQSAKTVAPVLVTRQNHIRFDLNDEEDGGTGSLAVYDYLRSMWTQFRYLRDGDSALAPSAQLVAPDGSIYWLDGDGVLWRERGAAYCDVDDAILPYRVRSGWLKPAGPQGYFTAARGGILGKFGVAHTLTVNVYGDFDEDTIIAANTWDVTAEPSAGYQFVASIATARTARMQAIAIEAIVSPLSGSAVVGPEAPAELSSFILEWDPIDGAPQRRIPAAQKR
jgi:hypothetical protein